MAGVANSKMWKIQFTTYINYSKLNYFVKEINFVICYYN